jgi:hypothetical protein
MEVVDIVFSTTSKSIRVDLVTRDHEGIHREESPCYSNLIARVFLPLDPLVIPGHQTSPNEFMKPLSFNCSSI